MRPYAVTLAVVWLTWFAALVAASVHDDLTGGFAAYLVWFLGVPAAVLISVLASASIAGAQCLEAGERG